MNPVDWFEIPVTDMARARKFYESVLEMKLEETVMGPLVMAWFPMEMDIYGATGSLVKGEGATPSACGTVVYFSTPDIDAALARVEAGGGKTLVPKMPIGEYGFIGHFLDTEGNRVALHTPPAK